MLGWLNRGLLKAESPDHLSAQAQHYNLICELWLENILNASTPYKFSFFLPCLLAWKGSYENFALKRLGMAKPGNGAV